MKRIDMKIAILDGTSRAHLISAIRCYEDFYAVNVLTFIVGTNHKYFMLVFDGTSVTKRSGDIDQFLVDQSNDNMILWGTMIYDKLRDSNLILMIGFLLGAYCAICATD